MYSLKKIIILLCREGVLERNNSLMYEPLLAFILTSLIFYKMGSILRGSPNRCNFFIQNVIYRLRKHTRIVHTSIIISLTVKKNRLAKLYISLSMKAFFTYDPWNSFLRFFFIRSRQISDIKDYERENLSVNNYNLFLLFISTKCISQDN